MNASGSHDYALVRMQSRLSNRLSAAAWRALEHVRALESFVAQARESGFSEVLQALGASPGVHEIEAALRQHWRASVERLARWMPEEWSRAVLWCAVIADLPALGHRVEGRERHAWMAEDAVLRALVSEPGDDGGTMRLRGPLAGVTDSRLLARAWLAEWRRRFPEGERSGLEPFERLVAGHAERFANADPHDAVALRRALESRLMAIFRANALEPVAAFAWLGLLALELERLRGELVTRSLVPAGVAP